MSAGDLVALVRGRRTLVLTGAGCSTESGIPSYRGQGAADRPAAPVQYQAFRRDPEARRRYWARSVLGFARLSGARPNAAHHALSALEARRVVSGLITQNVDRLHHAAGSREVIELHGAIARVRCLGCGAIEPRAALQTRLLAANPGFDAGPAASRPDGDAELDAERARDFVVVGCSACDGVLKPDVVFFGENVPAAIVEAAYAQVAAAEALLVVGSSLAVFSGYRFVRRAVERKIPVAIVNLGPTRGDPLATLKLDASAGETLARLAEALASA
ncbi:MAG: NAD-dependent protein deacetylase [Polyangiaceae bacterium]|nr:NAD-dependent protein deacetylase [Polyangiaceae bacterium]